MKIIKSTSITFLSKGTSLHETRRFSWTPLDREIVALMQRKLSLHGQFRYIFSTHVIDFKKDVKIMHWWGR
jgi:hypothetical protein